MLSFPCLVVGKNPWHVLWNSLIMPIARVLDVTANHFGSTNERPGWNQASCKGIVQLGIYRPKFCKMAHSYLVASERARLIASLISVKSAVFSFISLKVLVISDSRLFSSTVFSVIFSFSLAL